MKNRSLVLTLFLTICFSMVAQDSYQEKIMKYLEVNGSEKQYSEAYDSMFDLLKRQFATSNVPEDVWKTLQADKQRSMNSIKKQLVFAYRNSFTEADIIKMTEFYKSEAGKQLVKNSNALTPEQSSKIGAYNNSEVGIKVQAAQSKLSKDISTISTDWSRQLYLSKLGALVKAGYKAPQN